MTRTAAPFLIALALLAAACSESAQQESAMAQAPDAEQIKSDLLNSRIGETGGANACEVGWRFASLDEFLSLDVLDAAIDGDVMTLTAQTVVEEQGQGSLAADLLILYRQEANGEWVFYTVFSPRCEVTIYETD